MGVTIVLGCRKILGANIWRGQRFWLFKIIGVRISLGKMFWGAQCFRVNVLGCQIFGRLKFLGGNKILWVKLWVVFLLIKMFGCLNLLRSKIMGLIKILREVQMFRESKILNITIFRDQNILVYNFWEKKPLVLFGVLVLYGTKMLLKFIRD